MTAARHISGLRCSAGRLAAALAVIAPLAAPGSTAFAKRPAVHVSTSSRQHSTHSATVGVRVSVSTPPSGSPSGNTPSGGGGGGSAAPSPPPPPTIASDSPLLSNPEPAGPGSYWYPGPSGEVCIYQASASPACFAIVGPSAAPPVDVAGTAAGLAAQLDLTLAPIEASPAASRDGLTGAPSWFWLDDPPAAQSLSVSLDGETVSVTAQPAAVDWSFGDGGGLQGGPGVAFRDGPIPDAAVTHVYETRCLPGDRGSDPFVLASCGEGGYTVSAGVDWTISYDGEGPVSESGTLPTRTTEGELAYPVSEVRAFLGGGT